MSPLAIVLILWAIGIGLVWAFVAGADERRGNVQT